MELIMQVLGNRDDVTLSSGDGTVMTSLLLPADLPLTFAVSCRGSFFRQNRAEPGGRGS